MVDPNGAVRADAASTGVGDGGPSGIAGNQSFALEGWYRSTGTKQVQQLVDFGGPGAGKIAGLGIWDWDTNDSRVLLDTFSGVNSWPTAPVDLFDGNWHHMALSYDMVTGKVNAYVDGNDLGQQTPPNPINLTASNIRLGWWIDAAFNKPFVGDLDEVAVYGGTLSAERIEAHFDSSSKAAAPPTAAPSNAFTLAVPKTRCKRVCKSVSINVTVPGAGVIAAQDANVASVAKKKKKKKRKPKPLIKSTKVNVTKAGLTKVKLSLTSTAKKSLKKKKKVKLKLRVTFTPNGGTANTKIASATPRVKKKAKKK